MTDKQTRAKELCEAAIKTRHPDNPYIRDFLYTDMVTIYEALTAMAADVPVVMQYGINDIDHNGVQTKTDGVVIHKVQPRVEVIASDQDIDLAYNYFEEKRSNCWELCRNTTDPRNVAMYNVFEMARAYAKLMKGGVA